MSGFDAVVLAGGAARRLGGADKPAVTVGGRALLDRVLDACRGAGRTVVVGGRRPTGRPVHWAREQPPGGGPVAALAAGLRLVEADTVVVLGGDLPFLGDSTVPALLAALTADGASPAEARADGQAEARADAQADAPAHADTGAPADAGTGALVNARTDAPAHAGTGAPADAAASAGAGAPAAAEGVLMVDGDGRDQPLTAVYRTEPLRREIALLAAEHGSLPGLPLRLLTDELALRRIEAGPLAAFDCDTWEDIAAARSRIRDHGRVLDEWIAAVKAELGIELDVDTGLLLDLARDAAHGVARPAAPLTTFLVGYAAAQAAAGPRGEAAVAEAARTAAALARRWAEEDHPTPEAGPA
ncbi:molybdenum cofactor guanylyltransferase [Streptomyces solincola]|uniref:Molybdenum cofactor guanylyltransferase n=1 Tax=Streptomyces solincola TaxID=2100817 RepID=A0A2S9PY26_9ACTN|nr:DUF6457 domain-containing protein [Streptomyces solincola]PRH79320.1 molybdenum cofactor guanylyltransferase [Streptomyces solincola]